MEGPGLWLHALTRCKNPLHRGTTQDRQCTFPYRMVTIAARWEKGARHHIFLTDRSPQNHDTDAHARNLSHLLGSAAQSLLLARRARWV